MRRWIFGMGAVVGTMALVLACSVGTDCDFGQCPGAAVGSEGGSGSDGDTTTKADATPPGCDGSKEQKDQAACLNDDFAIFVAPTGKPDSPGTKLAPVNTLARATELAVAARQRIFVCDGTYDERVILKTPVSIYGGLTCSGGVWNSSPGHAVFGRSQEAGFGLDVVKVPGEFELVDMEFAAAPGTALAQNSIAARVVGTPGLTLKRVTLTAQQGADGDPGGSGATGVRNPVVAKGNPGTTGGGGGALSCSCSVGNPTSGGTGGGPANGSGTAGTGDAVGAFPTDGQGGTGGITNCGTGIGHEGASAANALPAEAGKKFGTITSEEWVPAAGLDGVSGGSGQGGGGGGANTGGGGGGGCGGCGGSGGKGGKGGGASVGLFAVNSPVKVVGAALKVGPAGKGGKGGKAGSGGMPGFGGDPGSGGAQASGCAGGQGGRGGDGGHGSGGPGGVSIGILYQGGAPVPDAATTTTQTGTAATGGDVADVGGNAGPTGKQLTISDAATL